MFIEEIKPDNRPFLAVYAPGREFLYKYFDRDFDCRITSDPFEVSSPFPAILISGIDDEQSSEKQDEFVKNCREKELVLIHLRVPDVIGTGMGGLMLRMARGVARGTLMLIKGNEAKRSVIHATDITKAAKKISLERKEAEFVISAPSIPVNDLIDALSYRIKNKRIGTVSSKWAKFLYGKTMFDQLTVDKVVNTKEFEQAFQDFVFVNPAEYLKTHIYDNESL